MNYYWELETKCDFKVVICTLKSDWAYVYTIYRMMIARRAKYRITLLLLRFVMIYVGM